MTRLEKLNECLQIAQKHKNPLMEENIRKEIQHELNNPSTDIYPDKESED